MKKIIAMLLLSVMSLSLVACGGKEAGLVAGEGQEAVEITAENWATYFEIEERVLSAEVNQKDKEGDIVEGADGKPVKVNVAYVDYYLTVKDEYVDKFEKAELTFKFTLGKQAVKKINYNFADQTYTLEDSTIVWPADVAGNDPEVKVTEAETRLYINAYYGDGVESGTYTGDVMTRPELTVKEVKGSILLKK